MTLAYSRFIALQRDMTSLLVESPIMEHLRRPIAYSSERRVAVPTENLSDEYFGDSEAPPMIHDIDTSESSPVSPTEVRMETSVPME